MLTEKYRIYLVRFTLITAHKMFSLMMMMMIAARPELNCSNNTHYTLVNTSTTSMNTYCRLRYACICVCSESQGGRERATRKRRTQQKQQQQQPPLCGEKVAGCDERTAKVEEEKRMRDRDTESERERKTSTPRRMRARERERGKSERRKN